MAENNSIVPNISQNILINFVPETEKQKVEDELEKCKKQLKEAEIRKSLLESVLSRNLLSIREYVDTEKILREENEKLNQKIIMLENENRELKKEIFDLKERMLKMEEREKENQKMLQIGQCVYDFKEQIWTMIFYQNKKEKIKKQRSIGHDNLMDLLSSNMYDDELSESQIEIKNNIAKNIKKHFNIKYLFNSLNKITKERNYLSHPNVKQSYGVLYDDFLNYCNEIWEDEEEENKIFAKYIFDTLDNV